MALGCGESESGDVKTYTAPKEPPPAQPVEWTLPQGWRQVQAQQMQFAAFAVDPDRTDATLSILSLARDPSELAMNVNRWEGQLGLPPSSPQAVERMVTHVDTAGGAHADVVDLSGTETKTQSPQRIVAAIVPHGTLTWFFTLKGPPDAVTAQKANFDAFVKSLKFKGDGGGEPAHAHAKGDGHDHAGHDHAGHDHAGHSHGPAEPVADRIVFGTLPAGWVEDPTPRPMRAHTVMVEADGKKGEVIISRMPPQVAGQLLDNLNRWRGQVGLAETTDPKSHPHRDLKVAGTPGYAFDFEGPAKDGQPAKRQIVAMTSQGEMFWFFRFIGPTELVAGQKEPFEKLLADAKFDLPAAATSQPGTK